MKSELFLAASCKDHQEVCSGNVTTPITCSNVDSERQGISKYPEASGNVTTRSMIYQDLTFQAVLVLVVMLPHQTFTTKLNQLEVVTLPHPE